MLGPTVNDTVFTFATRSPSGMATRELWASRSALVASEYWRTLFESDFVETQGAGGLEPAQRPREVADEAAGEVIDSDDDTDALLPLPTRSIGRPSTHVIRVTDAAFSTYRAVLLYVLTASIVFAPLASRGPIQRQDFIAAAVLEHPELPPPVSPRAVYRLADKLELVKLRVRAAVHAVLLIATDARAVQLPLADRQHQRRRRGVWRQYDALSRAPTQARRPPRQALADDQGRARDRRPADDGDGRNAAARAGRSLGAPCPSQLNGCPLYLRPMHPLRASIDLATVVLAT